MILIRKESPIKKSIDNIKNLFVGTDIEQFVVGALEYIDNKQLTRNQIKTYHLYIICLR